MRRAILAATAAVLSQSAFALSDDPVRIALDLGTVIGSEQACGLSYDLAAIEAFIDSNAPASDMQFMSTMNTSVSATHYDMRRFSEAQKAAHCAQIRRVAKSYGFVK